MKLGRVPIVFMTINIGCHILPVMHSYKEMCMHLLISTITSITLSCTINSFKGPLKTGTIAQIQGLSAKQHFKIHYNKKKPKIPQKFFLFSMKNNAVKK